MPIRTCVGCRRVAPINDLVRCAYDAQTDAVVVDSLRNRPGRGAWIHPNKSCVIRAIKSRSFTRALKLGNNGNQTAFDEVALMHLEQLSHPVRKSRAADE